MIIDTPNYAVVMSGLV